MKCSKCGTSIADNCRYCPTCGNSAQVNQVETSAVKKTHVHKKRITVIIVASIVILLVLVLFLGQRNKFSMEADGTLYCEHPISDIIEIPRKYDGKAHGFSGDYSSWNYKYDGTLQQFLKYHSWVIYENYDAHTSQKTIYCKDYILQFATNGQNLGTTYKPNDSGLFIKVYFEVCNQQFGTIECFETLSDLKEWLN